MNAARSLSTSLSVVRAHDARDAVAFRASEVLVANLCTQEAYCRPVQPGVWSVAAASGLDIRLGALSAC